MKPTQPTRDEIRELLNERWPSLPFAKVYGKTAGGISLDPNVNPLSARLVGISERIDRSRTEVRRLKKIVAKRKAAKP